MNAGPGEVGLEAFPFHFHGEILGVAAVAVIGYIYGVRVLGRRHVADGTAAVTRRQVAWFATGIALFLLVEAWPVHDIAEKSLFSFHMAEHMVLALLVPPAILKGVPAWLLRLLLRPVLPALRVMTRPLPAIIFFNGVLALIHVPRVIEAMVTSAPVHFTFHLLLVTSATLMWWPVIGPIPELGKLRPELAMGYLFLQSLVPTVPASFLTFADGVVYKVYENTPRLWGFDVGTDQTVAGLIMKLGGGIVLWTAIAVIFFRWAAAEERAGRAHTGASRVRS